MNKIPFATKTKLAIKQKNATLVEKGKNAPRSFPFVHPLPPLEVARNSKSTLKDKTKAHRVVCFCFMVAGVGFEPHDLRVMSPTSYQAALPRDRVN